MVDSVSIDIPEDEKKSKSDDGLGSMLVSGIKKIHLLQYLLFFLIGLIILSDLFINNVLGKINGLTEQTSVLNKIPNNKGTIVQLVLLVLAFLILDIIFKWNLFQKKYIYNYYKYFMIGTNFFSLRIFLTIISTIFFLCT